jgi:hypothetical protein
MTQNAFWENATELTEDEVEEIKSAPAGTRSYSESMLNAFLEKGTQGAWLPATALGTTSKGAERGAATTAQLLTSYAESHNLPVNVKRHYENGLDGVAFYRVERVGEPEPPKRRGRRKNADVVAEVTPEVE